MPKRWQGVSISNHSDDPNAELCGMLPHVFVERHGFQNDAFMYLAGIEQVEPAFVVPLGQADV